MKILLVLALLSFAGCTKKAETAALAATPPPAAQTTSSAVPAADPLKKTCLKGTEKREVEIVKKENGCVLNYTESGKTKEEATGKLGTGKCEIKEKHLVARLEHSGFKCQ